MIVYYERREFCRRIGLRMFWNEPRQGAVITTIDLPSTCGLTTSAQSPRFDHPANGRFDAN